MSFHQHYLAGAPCQMLTIVLWSMNNNAGWWGMRVQTHESSHSNNRTPVHVADIKSSNDDSQMFDLHENPGKSTNGVDHQHIKRHNSATEVVPLPRGGLQSQRHETGPCVVRSLGDGSLMSPGTISVLVASCAASGTMTEVTNPDAQDLINTPYSDGLSNNDVMIQTQPKHHRPSAAVVKCFVCGILAHYIWLVLFFAILTFFVVFGGVMAAARTPGDGIRRELQSSIIKALASSNWASVESKFQATEHGGNSALIIGDASGSRFEIERGWASLDEKYALASQTKIVTALTIHRLLNKTNGALRLDSRVSDWVDGWPSDSIATLEHLLAFTTGFSQDIEPGCARVNDEEQPSWQACVDEISQLPLVFDPGESFLYGPWHFVVAAAITHRALGRDLTKKAWIASVREEVFAPAGIQGPPVFCGLNSDAPGGYPIIGSWYLGSFEGEHYPDFSGGLCMSGHDLRRFQQHLLFDEPILEDFTRDRTANVKTFKLFERTKFENAAGSWHYAQGAWITCDAAAESSTNGIEAANELCGESPTPRVLHSVGFWGAYAWIDLTNNYYGVFVHSWAVDLANMFWIALSLSLFCAVAFGFVSAFCCIRRCCPGLNNHARVCPGVNNHAREQPPAIPPAIELTRLPYQIQG